MRSWDTFGAFGDHVIELSLFDIVRLLLGRKISVRSTIIHFGPYRIPRVRQAKTREEQLYG